MSSGGDPPTPVTEIPSSLLSESTETHTLMVLWNSPKQMIYQKWKDKYKNTCL